MSESIWVFDSFEDTIQEWTLDDLIMFSNESSDQLYFSTNKEDIEEQKRLYIK